LQGLSLALFVENSMTAILASDSRVFIKMSVLAAVAANVRRRLGALVGQAQVI
jgi:hypothetical protein